MITNIKIETDDEERNLIARSLGTSGLVSRKQLNQAVQEFVGTLIHGVDDGPVQTATDPRRRGRDQRNDGSAGDQGLPDVPDPLGAGFKPSRGDEPYLYKPRNVALKDACSAMLDQAELVEQMVWDILEKNRAD